MKNIRIVNIHFLRVWVFISNKQHIAIPGKDRYKSIVVATQWLHTTQFKF